MKQQLQEAIYAGRRALDTLHDAKKLLGSAEGWGIFDLLGGGMLATMIKRSKMGEAKETLDTLKADLKAFQRELRDVEIITDPEIDTGGFLAFSDLFFDDFLSDFLVQRKINKAQSQLKAVERQVQSIVDALNAKYRSL